MNTIIKTGQCICVSEPRADASLEGFNYRETYKYEYMEKDKDGNPYYRVYHSTDYYETCGVNTFKKYFNPLEV